MSKSAIAAVAILMVVFGCGFVLSQTAPPAKKPAKKLAVVHPNTKVPAKVTGDGVKTESGLQYWDIVVGTGAVAKEGDRVRVHYTGWLTTGKKFDSSVDAGRPFTFALGNGEVIRGWDEGIEGMKVGGKRQLHIPPELGYGEGGSPDGTIPSNSTLIFDVQLLSVEPPVQ
jgi:FKBP-type peptidyl-prolyl cis-trans isomerase FkpA